MELLTKVKALEGKSSYERFNVILRQLDYLNIPYDIHYYASGSNIIVGDTTKKFVGVGAHFDVVQGSPGANDNGSSCAVVLALIEKFYSKPVKNINPVFFFFDEEEVGMKGSRTYIEDNSIQHMKAYINMEMVGMGDKLALWSANEHSKGKALELLEEVAAQQGISSQRFERIIGRYADHVPFRDACVEDSFSVTVVSQEDIDISFHYYKAQEFKVDKEVLEEIFMQAPIFKHYHQPSDLTGHLSEQSLRMVESVVYQTLCKLSL